MPHDRKTPQTNVTFVFTRKIEFGRLHWYIAGDSCGLSILVHENIVVIARIPQSRDELVGFDWSTRTLWVHDWTDVGPRAFSNIVAMATAILTGSIPTLPAAQVEAKAPRAKANPKAKERVKEKERANI